MLCFDDLVNGTNNGFEGFCIEKDDKSVDSEYNYQIFFIYHAVKYKQIYSSDISICDLFSINYKKYTNMLLVFFDCIILNNSIHFKKQENFNDTLDVIKDIVTTLQIMNKIKVVK